MTHKHGTGHALPAHCVSVRSARSARRASSTAAPPPPLSRSTRKPFSPPLLQVCPVFTSFGVCANGGKCRLVHLPPPSLPPPLAARPAGGPLQQLPAEPAQLQLAGDSSSAAGSSGRSGSRAPGSTAAVPSSVPGSAAAVPGSAAAVPREQPVADAREEPDTAPEVRGWAMVLARPGLFGSACLRTQSAR